ncbi:MAG: hypothetical protein OXL41_10530 [Nitrospinae bacterium]|nr:hypothetical protein [Nitrospinota bacterium]
MPATPLLDLHQAANARLTEEAGWWIPSSYGDTVAEHLTCRESAVVIDLSHRGNLCFSGADAEEFLHRMLSNQVKELNPGEGAYNTFLTRQGKFISDLYMYRSETFVVASVAPGMAEILAEEIDRFIIMDQVEVTNETENSFCIGLFGPDSREIIAKAGMGEPSSEEHGHRTSGNMMIARELWTGEDGYLLMGLRDEAESVWRTLLDAGANPAGVAAFGSLTIEAGVPLFSKDMTSAVNPMQAGLEEKAIDFDKGCYIGQEVIAKIKYLGQVNRGLVGLKVEGKAVPEPGAAVYCDEKNIGAITRSAFCPTVGAVLAFAYLPRAQMEPGTEVRADCHGDDAKATVENLPFYRKESEVIG